MWLVAADAATYGIPIAALTISLIGLFISTFMNARTQSRSASNERVRQLEEEVDDLKERIAACENDRTRLRSENIELMRRLVRLEDTK